LVQRDGAVGETLPVLHLPSGQAVPSKARLLSEIGYVAFETCPICLSPSPSSREHVPPRALGGQVRTLTCHSCNNMLGARIEGELVDWCFDATRNARAEGPGALGLRRIPRILRRTDGRGRFVLVAEEPEPAVREMLTNGQLTLHWQPPDRNRYRLAALKHAYLAACCQMRSIPVGAAADQIRSDLVDARDAVSNSVVPHSAVEAALGLMRSYEGPQGPSLALALLKDGLGEDQVWLSLAGNLLVQWPLADHRPLAGG
jgi:hypothetical protein